MTSPSVAAVDIGGTKISVSVVHADGTITGRRTEPTPPCAADVVDTVARLLDSLGSPAAVGVGSAGVIDPRTGSVLSATDAIRGWAGTNLRDELVTRTGLRVVVGNDVHAHALGEAWIGRAHGAETLLFVAVGTGVGASLVIDGRIHHGAHGVAGHLGHVPVAEADDRTCTCGAMGHLEAVASGPAMTRAYADRADAALSLVDIARRADLGDALAETVIVGGGAAVGRAIGGVVNVVDPDIVVVGGGVAGCGPRWVEALTRAARAHILPAAVDVPLEVSTLGADAALLGAARLAWQEVT